ncbi:MAG: hypothetical protein LBT80_00945 [Lactobacillaceae bacterium]|nr:hypothetical protein [Lactobacillaceae bacterium]
MANDGSGGTIPTISNNEENLHDDSWIIDKVVQFMINYYGFKATEKDNNTFEVEAMYFDNYGAGATYKYMVYPNGKVSFQR